MKKRKFHPLPLETPFLQKIRTRAEYSNESHYTNFNGNSIEIIPFDHLTRYYWPTDTIFEKILTTLRLHNLRFLTKLTLSIETSFPFEKAIFRRLALALTRYLKTLKQLDLRFISSSILEENNLRDLLDLIAKTNRGLTEVNLYFLGEDDDLDSQYFKEIEFSLLKKTKRLRRLKLIVASDQSEILGDKRCYFEPKTEKWLEELNFYEWMGGYQTFLTQWGAAQLCSGISRYLTNLQSLTLTIPQLETWENKVATRDICKVIANLPNLKSLNLSFIADYYDKEIDEISYYIGLKLRKLRHLSLFFNGDWITDDGLQKLSSNIFSFLPQLSYFAFSLNRVCQASNEGVLEFGIRIGSYLKKLKTLVLNFGFSKKLARTITSRLSQTFQENLLDLTKLVLKLGCNDCDEKINQSGPLVLPKKVQGFDLYLREVDCVIDKTWKNLRKLSLVFEGCGNYTSFLESFRESCPDMENLEHFKLLFLYPKKMTDAQINDITLAIGTNLKNLTSLELGCSYCHLLTSISLWWIRENLVKNLKKLSHFHLRFYELEIYRSGYLRHLVNLIMEELQELESLTLFFCCKLEMSDIESTLLETICPLITAFLKKLTNLALRLFPYEGYELSLETELKQKMRKQLCHIPRLYIS